MFSEYISYILFHLKILTQFAELFFVLFALKNYDTYDASERNGNKVMNFYNNGNYLKPIKMIKSFIYATSVLLQHNFNKLVQFGANFLAVGVYVVEINIARVLVSLL